MAQGHLTKSSLPADVPGYAANVAALATHAATAAGVHRVVAIGCLDMSTAAWLGAHPGFADAVTDAGVGMFTVSLAANGAATMRAKATATYYPLSIAGINGILAGAGLREVSVRCSTFVGAPSNPAGWNPGAVLGAPVMFDGCVIVEVIDLA